MDVLKLGQLIEGDQHRDAVHVAIAPVVASEKLSPGDHIGLLANGEAAEVSQTHIGVVDPFLKKVVKKGERFWMLLYPGTITGLRHEWTHPAFEAAEKAATNSDREQSEQWLRNFSITADCPDYTTLINAAVGDHHLNKTGDDDYLSSENDGEYLHFGGSDAHGEIPPEFWDHVQIVTGRLIPQAMRAKSFSCSC